MSHCKLEVEPILSQHLLGRLRPGARRVACVGARVARLLCARSSVGNRRALVGDGPDGRNRSEEPGACSVLDTAPNWADVR